MKSFGSDNHSGIHPKILESLTAASQGHAPSYGTDEVTKNVIKKFQQAFDADIDVHFVFNGTAANVLALRPFVESHNSIICHSGAHLNIDECGAPEKHLGTKLIPLDGPDGKLRIEDIERALVRGGDQHYSQPKVLSLTQPTEVGTLYSVDELRSLIDFAHSKGLFVHIDGARFAVACAKLNCSFADLTTKLGVDSLSFGGTKNGLLYGEAVICFNKTYSKQMRYYRKQFMQLPSKMRFLSAQFEAYLNEDLWRKIALHEIEMAQYLHQHVKDIPQVEVLYPVQANSVFAKLPKDWIKPLREHSFFYVWDENEWSVRWMCSYDSNRTDVDSFVAAIKALQ